MANDTLQGWSRTTWSNGAFGVEGTVVVSGVQASNSSGSSSAIGTAGVPATGLQATGGVGQVSSFQSAYRPMVPLVHLLQLAHRTCQLLASRQML
jgi:hypothetical protein